MLGVTTDNYKMNSTINHSMNYTMNYIQPTEYHFSLDSVILPKLVAKDFLPKFYLTLSETDSEINQIYTLGSNFLDKNKKAFNTIISNNNVSNFESKFVLKVLDLCSGTGVIGIEFIFHWINFVKQNLLPYIESIQNKDLSILVTNTFNLEMHFVEVQAAYKDFFEKNIEIMKLTLQKELSDSRIKLNIHFHLINYKDFNLRKILIKNSKINDQCLDKSETSDDSTSPFDLILANPPYFQKNQGRLSPSDLKNRSRFYLDSDFETFCQLLPALLKPGASANMVFRSLKEHKSDLYQRMHLYLSSQGQIAEKENIRTAKWISFTKK